MTIDVHSKQEIRKHLLLELNNCFVKISRQYSEPGREAEQEFVQTLIRSIKSCVEDATYGPQDKK
jgi:hypothetical protein